TAYEYGFVSAINTPTRVTKNSSTCLDHIFIKSKHHKYDTIIPITISTSITDHFTTLVQIVLNSKFYRQINDKKLLHLMQNMNWEDVYQDEDLDSATNKFLKTTQTTEY
ncbi:hypothetical protein NQ317_006915, partial [Molorchus minor]